ncbi:hypothetical protein [Alicyclobacillus acidocaldarius]|uniref:hypothetical protein n=1 Tax=Alicyclobacillus acidocaldarius TaxID=405212 RepID=UPI00059FA3A2|nr:hypothetical protein [Alicyclobacillus acidocaldarius]
MWGLRGFGASHAFSRSFFSHSYGYGYGGYGLGHMFVNGLVHGLGFGIGYGIARHIPFTLILVIAIVALVWWLARRR